MLPVFSLLLLALGVSLDGFGVGVTYGLRKIRIPLRSIAIIALCSGLIIYLSMQLGVWLSRFVDPVLSRWIGALILIGIGLWAIRQVRTGEEGAGGKTDDPKPCSHSAESGEGKEDVPVPPAAKVLYIELKRFGLVIQILKTPSIADIDRSGVISPSEAMLLGLALSLDAFGAGFGAALLGFSPWLTSAVIALASGIFLGVGLRIGLQHAGWRWMRKMSALPGVLLIAMGLLKLL
ncbi:sporulation membrane protein YtaF [Paenibacillus ginsengihumi]|jgi:putative sporulation protein YtaF|uniref:sporulation membrane protein YtaF n=1 Tax=Paenibacillus ginsengihumi TaxID=431596 RepID=UPI00036911E7|nr:sporulation membrane protein YtaF [Paenibacillus ginsengihumi]